MRLVSPLILNCHFSPTSALTVVLNITAFKGNLSSLIGKWYFVLPLSSWTIPPIWYWLYPHKKPLPKATSTSARAGKEISSKTNRIGSSILAVGIRLFPSASSGYGQKHDICNRTCGWVVKAHPWPLPAVCRQPAHATDVTRQGQLIVNFQQETALFRCSGVCLSAHTLGFLARKTARFPFKNLTRCHPKFSDGNTLRSPCPISREKC